MSCVQKHDSVSSVTCLVHVADLYIVARESHCRWLHKIWYSKPLMRNPFICISYTFIYFFILMYIIAQCIGIIRSLRNATYFNVKKYKNSYGSKSITYNRIIFECLHCLLESPKCYSYFRCFVLRWNICKFKACLSFTCVITLFCCLCLKITPLQLFLSNLFKMKCHEI